MTISATPETHLEAEKGVRISKTEHGLLQTLLPLIGFAFTKRSSITDFVLPDRGETTRRMRVERILSSADGSQGLHCIRGLKNHPIPGRPGQHVRRELEREVTFSSALTYILRAIEKQQSAVPYYHKERWHFQGVYEGYLMTIALDHAVGLGRYSGFYMEIETILPVGSTQVNAALAVIDKLSEYLLSERRAAKISYRKMLMSTWPQQAAAQKTVRKAKAKYTKLFKKIAAADTQKGNNVVPLAKPKKASAPGNGKRKKSA